MIGRRGIVGILAWSVVCLVWISWVGSGYGQPPLLARDPYQIRYWSTEDGLPENSATAQLQTQEGYLWVGTFAGLVRFDGVRFTVFHPGNTPAMRHAGVVNLHLDREQRMWISTMDGLTVMKDGEWWHLGAAEGWVGDYVRRFAETREGLYATTFDGKVLQLTPHRVVALPDPGGNSRRGYLAAAEGGEIFRVVQGQFSFVWDGRGWTREVLDFLDGTSDVSCVASRDGAIWYCQAGKLWKVRRGRMEHVYELNEPVRGLWSMMEDTDGKLWLASFLNGLTVVDPGVSERRYSTKNGLSYDGLREVFEDREHQFWVGTSGGGLMRFSPKVCDYFGVESGLPARALRSVSIGPGGDLVLGTFGAGTFVWSGDRKEEVKLVPEFRGGQAFVEAVLADRDGRMWVGSYGEGLYRREPDGRTVRMMREMGEQTVRALYEDSLGRIWAGGESQVWYFVPREDVAVAVQGEGLAGARCFAEDPRDGAIWMSGNKGGLFRWFGGTCREVKGPFLVGGAPILINAILVEPGGDVWVGTSGRGLMRYREGKWTSLGEDAGFGLRIVTALQRDADGDLWVGGNQGIWKLDRRSVDRVVGGGTVSGLSVAGGGVGAGLRYKVLGRSEGLLSVECPEGSCPGSWKSADGTLWFATLKGLVAIQPATVRWSAIPPGVVLERMVYLDERGTRVELSGPLSGTVKLPPGVRSMSVEYTALSFVQPDRLRFAYRMGNGVESGWVDLGTRRSMEMERPRAGLKRLRVRASNAEGVWDERGAELTIEVGAHFWQTPWFRGVVVGCLILVTAGVVWAVGHQRLRDRLAQLESDRELEAQKARLASVMEATTDLVAFTTASGKLLYLNPAGRRMLGCDAEEDITALGLSPFYGVAEERKIMGVAIPFAVRHGAWRGDVVLKNRAGKELQASQVMVAHRNERGELDFLSMVVRDMTEQRRVAEELHRAQQLESLGRLAGGVAHDFNNLLGAMMGNLHLASQDLEDRHPAQESLKEMDKAVQRARDLVRRILTFGRKQTLDRRWVDLGQLIEEAVRLFRPILPAGITMELSISAVTPPVYADATQVHQAILNLCTNAVHALGGMKGTVLIALWTVDLDVQEAANIPGLMAGRYACVSVRDTGVGMTPEVMSRIFEPFFTTKKTDEGTGLGLSMVHGIMQNHEGAVTVRSRPGVGTTFYLYFPIVDGEGADGGEDADAGGELAGRVGRVEAGRGEAESLAMPLRRAGIRRRVLYVDDEQSLVFLVRRLLERQGYEVQAFCRVKEALDVYAKDPGAFDVVITDLNMPGMTGIEVAEQVRRMRPEALVVLSSGYVTEEMRQQALKVGIAHVLYKSNTVQEFTDSIHRLLAKLDEVVPPAEG